MRTLLAFSMNDMLLEQVNDDFLIKAEIWEEQDLNHVKNVHVLVNQNLYLQIYTRWLQVSESLLESHFKVNFLEDFAEVKETDIIECYGGILAGITVDDEYVELGEFILIDKLKEV